MSKTSTYHTAAEYLAQEAGRARVDERALEDVGGHHVVVAAPCYFFLFQFNEPCREEEEPTKTISPGSAPDIIDMFSIWVVGMRRTVLPQRREWRGVPGIRCAFPTTKTEKKLQTKGET